MSTVWNGLFSVTRRVSSWLIGGKTELMQDGSVQVMHGHPEY